MTIWHTLQVVWGPTLEDVTRVGSAYKISVIFKRLMFSRSIEFVGKDGNPEDLGGKLDRPRGPLAKQARYDLNKKWLRPDR